MCGINGIIAFPISEKHGDLVKMMNRQIAHRGPENDGLEIGDFYAIGHRRLSIIDLNSRSNQPLLSTCKRYSIVFNGEIYNYKELKRGLDYSFQTDSDSEVVLALFITHGSACIHLLDGMFAFAIVDKLTRSVFIGRDRLGKKPFYYYFQNNQFVFSSEVRGLFASGLVEKKLNEEGIFQYFKYKTVYSPNTIIDNVKVLEAGHFMQLLMNDGSINLTNEKYWSLSQIQTSKNELNLSQIHKTIKNKFIESVEKRLVADVPVASFLSGGIDSTAVVAAMRQLSNREIHSFNVNFSEGKYSEAPYARFIAEKFKLTHHEINLSPEYFLNHLEEGISSMDHPSEDGLNVYMISKAVKDFGFKVVLSGVGGDELFGGYYTFDLLQKAYSNRIFWHLPLFLRKSLGEMRSIIRPGLVSDFIKQSSALNKFDLNELHACLRNSFSNNDLDKLLNIQSVHENIPQIDKGESFFADISKHEILAYLQNILLRDTDQMSMANSIEVRAPFCDFNLIEYVLSLPEEILIAHSHKKLLVESLGEDLVPSKITNRTKMGFVLPIEYWIKNQLYDWSNKKIESLANRSFCNGEHLLFLWSQFNNNSAEVPYHKIWPLILLESYLQKNEL